MMTLTTSYIKVAGGAFRGPRRWMTPVVLVEDEYTLMLR